LYIEQAHEDSSSLIGLHREGWLCIIPSHCWSSCRIKTIPLNKDYWTWVSIINFFGGQSSWTVRG